MADDTQGSSFDSEKLQDDLLGAKNHANAIADAINRAMKDANSNTKLGRQIANDLKASLITEVNASERVAELTRIRNNYIEEQVKLGKTKQFQNQTLIKALNDQIDIYQREAEIDEQNQRRLDILKGINDELTDGLGLLGQWLRVGTDIEMASQALKATMGAIGSVFDNTLGTIVSFNRELGISGAQSAEITSEAIKAGLSWDGLRFNTEELNAAAKSYVETLGTANGATAGILTNIADITKLTGDSEGAVRLSSIFESASQDSQMLTENIKQLAEKEGVASSRVFKGLVKSSKLLVGASEQHIKNIAKLNIELEKQGLNMEALDSISDNMLNIESSLRSQMKARLLLGDKLNESQFAAVDSVRQQSLLYQQGNINQEQFLASIKGMVISAEQFNSLGPAGMRVYGDMVGLGVDGLTDMYNQQAALQKQAAASPLSKLMGDTAKVWESIPSFIKNATTALIGYIAQSAILNKMQSGGLGIGKLFGLGKSSTTPQASASNIPAGDTASKGISGLTSSISKINTTALIKGAAAMVIVSAAVWVFGKAVQEFVSVRWQDVVKGIIAMGALTAAVIGVGIISTIAGYAILAGAAAMLIIAGSIWVLGKAIQEMAIGFKQMGLISDTLSTLISQISGIGLVSLAFMGLAGSLTALGMAGIVAMPGINALIMLAAVAPALSKLADSFGFGGTDGEDGIDGESKVIQTENKELLNEIRGLRNDLKTQPIILNVDGRVISQITRVQNIQGKNERAFKSRTI